MGMKLWKHAQFAVIVLIEVWDIQTWVEIIHPPVLAGENELLAKTEQCSDVVGNIINVIDVSIVLSFMCWRFRTVVSRISRAFVRAKWDDVLISNEFNQCDARDFRPFISWRTRFDDILLLTLMSQAHPWFVVLMRLPLMFYICFCAHSILASIKARSRPGTQRGPWKQSTGGIYTYCTLLARHICSRLRIYDIFFERIFLVQYGRHRSGHLSSSWV